MSNIETLRHFKSGDDPRRNVTGANKGSKWLSTLLVESLKKMAEGSGETYDALLIKRVLKKAIVDGDMRAIEHVWDRVEGGVKTKEEPGDVYNVINVINVEQQQRIARRVVISSQSGKGESHRLSDSNEPEVRTELAP